VRDEVTIAGRRIGQAHPPYVIAEMSGNHNGDIKRAFRLIDAAADAGADAVKLQTYTADTITIDHDGPGFRLGGGLWAGRTLHDLYREAHTPWDWHARLFEHAHRRGIAIFSSPFDPTAIELLESLDAPAYKIASFELVDLPLIERAARTGKPLILSTGLATLGEIEEAVAAARGAGAEEILLLHCTSAYPTPPEEANLRTMAHMAAGFAAPVGLSDHTMGIAVPVAAVALGAVAIEKHFTLARADGGPDSAFSLEAPELKEMVAACRAAWAALGQVDYGVSPGEGGGRLVRRSLYVVEDVPAGAPLGAANVRSIRPGYGLPPKHLPEVLGRPATRALKRGEPLDWTMVGPGAETDR
jgi:N-acetylneuraminate synthase